MAIKESYSPVVLPANTATRLTGDRIGGFFCTASGTLTIVDSKGRTILNGFAVTAGNQYLFNFYIGVGGGTATTASSGAGTIGN